MPSYTNHILVNFALALILLFFYQTHPFLTYTQLALMMFGYFIGTTILSPDLDIKNSHASQKCGAFCKPLTMSSKHRGMQHHPIYGTLIRIFYIILVVSVLLLLFYGLPSVSAFLVILWTYKLEIFAISGGVFLANLFHILLDAVT
jgi:uncharacterized metal-binding protein